MKKSTKLRRRAKEMRELGEKRLANSLEKRADNLEKTEARQKKAEKEEQAKVLLYKEGDRVYIQPPDPGYRRRKAFSHKLKTAATEAGECQAQWEGKDYKNNDPRRSLWSVKDDPSIMERVKAVLGDFFSKGKVVSKDGEELFELPETTYDPNAA